MKIAIIGAGAMGSLLGFYLSGLAGHEVWLLDGWAEHVQAVQQHGLACEREGITQVRQVYITTAPGDIGICDVVIVLVKAHQTQWAAAQAQFLLKQKKRDWRTEGNDQSLVITLQNGVGNREALATMLPDVVVSQGVTMLGATLIGPGRVRHAGMGATYFAQLHSGDWGLESSNTKAPASTMIALVESFQATGLPAELRTDVEALVWNKLVVNAGINALTALLRTPNGALAATPAARDLVGKLVAEAVAVATARGISLNNDPLGQTLAVAEATATNRSSMLQDVLRGSPTEIGAINGAIVREGEHLGVPTPYNRMLTELVAALDATAALRV